MIIDKYRKLFSDSLIFAIGNFGSKLLSLLLVPLYVRFLTTSEYGTVDLVITTVNMILPLVSLSIYEGTLRYLFDKKENKDDIIFNSLLVTGVGTMASSFFILILNFYFKVEFSIIYLSVFLMIIQAFQVLVSQISRALGYIKIYAINGVIYTFFLGILNFIFLVPFSLKVNGYFLSLVITNIISIIFILMKTPILRYTLDARIDFKLILRMLSYSIPLIPNALMWWVMNAVSRYLILYFQGSSENGLYAVANKIPSIITMITTIFFQAWQIFAIEDYEEGQDNKIYTDVFKYFTLVLLVCSSVILLILKSSLKLILSTEYYPSWIYIPPLIMAAVFSSFGNFFAITYNAKKETTGILKTSLLGGSVNVIISIILIPSLGVIGASISSMIGFLVIWLYRMKDAKSMVDFRLDIRDISISFVILCLQIGLLYAIQNIFVNIFMQSICLIMLCGVYLDEIKTILSGLKKKR